MTKIKNILFYREKIFKPYKKYALPKKEINK